MTKTIALVGNPNSGKTSLFNALTGSNQYVGNWPGVTVEKKSGFTADHSCEIVDLPGVYSLSPYTMEEIITRDFIIKENPDAIINIIDGTNLERNLYLTLQVLELSIPTVIAVNMIDQVRARGGDINCDKLSASLGVPVISVSAKTGYHVQRVIKRAAELSGTDWRASELLRYSSGMQNLLTEIMMVLSDHCSDKKQLMFYAGKLIEQDKNVIERLRLPQKASDQIDTLIDGYVKTQQYNDRETLMADERYRFIGSLVGGSVRKSPKAGKPNITDRIDKIVTNRFLAIPIFFLIIFLMFGLTFGPVGSFLKDCVAYVFNDLLSPALERLLLVANAPDWTHSLLVDAVIGGVGGILTFVPQIVLLFRVLSFLEDSGYMARTAFIMDKIMRKFGLSGKSFIPMLMGFGCTTPAVMAARSLENEKDRNLTIMLTPFMSCGARLPIYALFAGIFFPENQGIVVFSMYILGMVVAMASGILLSKTVFRGVFSPFVLELPQYHMPSFKAIMMRTWEKSKGFIIKAGTVIFAMSIVVWFFQNFDATFHMVANSGDSMLGQLGKWISGAFVPLGFGNWQASVALLTGLVAKESVVSTISVLYTGAETSLTTALMQVFTPLSAYAFMTFTLLYMPCISAFATIRREMNSMKWALATALYQTGTAYVVALLIFQCGTLISRFWG